MIWAGSAASALVFAAFFMRAMLPLRLVAICSNAAFITYALIGGLLPILVLHACLLPLNCLRIWQLHQHAAPRPGAWDPPGSYGQWEPTNYQLDTTRGGWQRR